MTLRQYFPISAAALVLLIAAVHYLHVPAPILPLVFILLVGETLMGFQVEDQKVARILGELFRPTKSKT
jgi:hypothetical protein